MPTYDPQEGTQSQTLEAQSTSQLRTLDKLLGSHKSEYMSALSWIMTARAAAMTALASLPLTFVENRPGILAMFGVFWGIGIVGLFCEYMWAASRAALACDSKLTANLDKLHRTTIES